MEKGSYNACSSYMDVYFGKSKLELSKTREADAAISEWRSDLYNDVMQLRQHTDSYVSTDIIKGAIGELWVYGHLKDHI